MTHTTVLEEMRGKLTIGNIPHVAKSKLKCFFLPMTKTRIKGNMNQTDARIRQETGDRLRQSERVRRHFIQLPKHTKILLLFLPLVEMVYFFPPRDGKFTNV